jgi:endonuclease/exonuclease/phosphatase family metal-dependent hydrolase
LKDAYIKRARQVDILSDHIKNSPYPCMVCGDFNDTPVSYTYQKLKGKLKDAYLESGAGIGNTYFGSFPSFRIDYILHSRALTTLNFQTKKIQLSDHYPIICHFYSKESDN